MKRRFNHHTTEPCEITITDRKVVAATGCMTMTVGWTEELALAFAAKNKLVEVPSGEPLVAGRRNPGECGSLEWVKQQWPIKQESIKCSCGGETIRRDETPELPGETMDQWREKVRRFRVEHPGFFVSDKPTVVLRPKKTKSFSGLQH